MFSHTSIETSSSKSREECNEPIDTSSELSSSSIHSHLRRLSIGLGFCGFSPMNKPHYKSSPNLVSQVKHDKKSLLKNAANDFKNGEFRIGEFKNAVFDKNNDRNSEFENAGSEFSQNVGLVHQQRRRRHSVQYAQNLGKQGSLYEPDMTVFEPLATINSDLYVDKPQFSGSQISMNQFSGNIPLPGNPYSGTNQGIPRLWVTVDYMRFVQTITICLIRAENLNVSQSSPYHSSTLVILTQLIGIESETSENKIIGINQQNFKTNSVNFNAILRIDNIPEKLSQKSLRFTVFQLDTRKYNPAITMPYLEECTPLSQSQFSMQDILDLEDGEQKMFCCMLERRKSLQTFKNSEKVACSKHLNCSNMPKVLVEFKFVEEVNGWKIIKNSKMLKNLKIVENSDPAKVLTKLKSKTTRLEISVKKLKHIKMKKVEMRKIMVVLEVYLGLDLLKHKAVDSKEGEDSDLYLFIDGKVSVNCSREKLKRLRLTGSICSSVSKKKLFMFELSADVWEKICRNLVEKGVYKDWYHLFSMQ